jgi:hypothetical protein
MALMALENLPELNSVDAAPRSSVKIIIPSASTLHVKAKQAPAPVAIPSRVQPGRANKAGRMTTILASIEEDDDSMTAVPSRRKRPIIESDPEDMFDVPEDVEQNPMAPVKKKRKQQAEHPSNIPPALSLQLPPPNQLPPKLPSKSNSFSTQTLSRPQSMPSQTRLPSLSANPTPKPCPVPHPGRSAASAVLSQQFRPQAVQAAAVSGRFHRMENDGDDPMHKEPGSDNNEELEPDDNEQLEPDDNEEQADEQEIGDDGQETWEPDGMHDTYDVGSQLPESQGWFSLF